MYSLKWIVPIVLLCIVACHPKMQSADTNSADATTTTYTDLNVEQFAGMMNKKNVVVLDVRTPEETAQGKIDGAMEINVLEDDFADKVQTLDKKKTYLVYCRSGRRSQKAVEIMAGEGFKKLYNLLGGYNAWFAEKN